ncbi:MotA/TolQ/ExbB proton channel family protein [Kiritimatiellota bacterium B12222]|nr:MotA/TolQ/ExbB proton channel family protein [Kiritimatiellota bacterium B12222]
MKGFEGIFSTWGDGGYLLLPLALTSMLIFAQIFRSEFSMRDLSKQLRELLVLLEKKGLNVGSLSQEMVDCATPIMLGYAQALSQVKQGANTMSALVAVEEGFCTQQRKEMITLSALTAAAPLLGLLGTVAGMIHTFDAVAVGGGDTGSQVAEGISSALLTTQFGLVIALPGVFGSAHLYKRIRNLETHLVQCRFFLLELLEMR